MKEALEQAPVTLDVDGHTFELELIGPEGLEKVRMKPLESGLNAGQPIGYILHYPPNKENRLGKYFLADVDDVRHLHAILRKFYPEKLARSAK